MVVNKTNLTRILAQLEEVSENSIKNFASEDFYDGVTYVLHSLKISCDISDEDIKSVDIEKFKDYLKE